MEQVTLANQDRTQLKKAASRRLRASGQIPAVIYGQADVVSISVDAHQFSLKFAAVGENTVIKLQNGKTEYEVLVKDYQDDILTGHIQHVDFYHVSATKTLHARVPVHLSGNPVGVRNGGLLEQVTHEIEVECLAKDIPHAIKVDVSNLDLHQGVSVRDLTIPAGVKVLTNGDSVVVHIVTTRAEVEAPAAAAAAPAEGEAAAPAEGAAPAAKAQEKKA
jgi:large subunit ribosomal protein L25